VEALSKPLKLSSKESGSVTLWVFSEALGHAPSISWGISGTPPAKAAVAHQMLAGSTRTLL